MNMKKILLFLTLFTGMILAGCNDSFLEKYPVTSLTEENAFKSYDNFKAFMWYVMKCSLIRTSPLLQRQSGVTLTIWVMCMPDT